MVDKITFVKDNVEILEDINIEEGLSFPVTERPEVSAPETFFDRLFGF